MYASCFSILPSRRRSFLVVLGMTCLAGFSSIHGSAVGMDVLPEMFDSPPAHDATVGSAPGAASTEGGAAVYRVPIEVPPGRAGLQPTIAVAYNSRSGNGIAGMGWAISGLSSIHRCPQTLEQDGAMRAVRYDANDRLCLDGQRLVPVSGPYGVNGTVYRTEVDTFARVTQIGALTGSATCFKVEERSGHVMSYGAPASGATCTTSSRNARVQPAGAAATLSWLAEKEEDRVGNNVFYSYTNYGNGEVLVASIDYTGFGTAIGDRRVTFSYVARPTSNSPGVIDNDVSASYLGGGLTMQTQRLSRIDTFVGAQRVRAYRFDYNLAGQSVSQYSGRSLLQSVTECAYDPAEVCHPSSGFLWEDAPVAYTLRAPTIPALPSDVPQDLPLENALGGMVPSSGGTPGPLTFKTIGDLDGDGGRELLAWIQTSSSPTGQLYLMKSQPDRTFSAAVDVTGLGISNATWNYVDFDGDGRADIVKQVSGSGDGWQHLLVWKLGRGAWGTDPNAMFLDVVTDVPRGTNARPFYYVDFDGDGRTDILFESNDAAACGSDASGPRLRLSIYLNRITGRLVDGAAAHFVRASESAPICLNRTLSSGGLPLTAETFMRASDFDGDGRADIFIDGGVPPNRQRLVYVQPGAGADGVSYSSVPMATIGLSADEMGANASNTEKLVRWMDINGDGLEDFVFAQTGGSGTVPAYQWIVRLNKGGALSAPIATGNATGLGTWGSTLNGPPLGANFRYSGKITPIDVDSDGRQELLVPARIGAMYCTAFMAPPPQGQVCPRPGPDSDPNGNLPPCEPIRLCPVDPATGAEIVPSDHTYNFNLYGSDSPGPVLDQSTYVMHPLRFVVGTVNAATGLPRITVQEVQKDIYGDHVDDMYGDGLSDVVVSIGCQWTGCSAIADDANPNSPSHLPDGTSVASLMAGRKLFINENAGIGTEGPRPPELMHAAFNGVDDWAAWVYVPLALPTEVSSVAPLPLYTLPGSNPYVDARHYYFTSSMPVVQLMTQSTAAVPKEDPTFGAGVRSNSYSYEEAMYNHLGRGFQGFRKITETTLVLDSWAGRRQSTATTYHQKFPLTGKVQSITVADPAHAATPYRTETYAWRCNRTNRSELCPGDGSSPTAPQSNTVYAPYLDRQLVQIYDLSGAEAGSSNLVAKIDTINATSNAAFASGWDAYGNLRNQVVTSSDGTSGGAFVNAHTITTSANYTTNTNAWWLDKLDDKTVTAAISYAAGHALPSGASAPARSVKTAYQWNADRTPLSQTVQPGIANQELKTTYGYPAPSYGLPTSISISGSGLTPSPRMTQIAYTKDGTNIAADGYFVLHSTNPMGQVTTTRRSPRDGTITATVDPNLLQSVHTRDAFGRVTRTDLLDTGGGVRMPPVFSSWTACENGSCPGGYGEGAGETYAAWRVTTTQNGYPTTATWYDKLGRVVKTSHSGFNGMVQTLTEYDIMGTVKRISTPHYAGGAAWWTTFDSYDRLNRVKQKTSPGAEADPAHGDVRTTYTYTGTRTAIKVRGTGVSATCSSSTNLCMDMTRSHDVLGRLEQTVQNLGNIANYAVTDYWYDGAGNPVAARDAEGNVIRASYNDLGQRTQRVDPDAGTWNFTYDSLGELLTQTDARGVTTTHSYDALGRLYERTASDAAASDASLKVIRDSWTYDPPGSAGGAGLLGSAKRLKGASVTGLAQIWSESYSYHPSSKRLATTTSSLDGQPAWSTGLTYDNSEREQTVSYPSGLVVKKGYTAYGDPNALSNNATGVSYWAQTAADAWGTPTTESYVGGITGSHVGYASTGQLKQKKWSVGATVLDQWDYTYDSFGNLNSAMTSGKNGDSKVYPWSISIESHVYDGLQRLINANRTLYECTSQALTSGLCFSIGSAPVPPGMGDPYSPHYAYTASGNFSFKDDFSNAAPGAYIHATNGCGPHAASEVATPSGTLLYRCDANGNVVGGNTLTASYDFNNQPWSVSRNGVGLAQFAYDSNGQRFKELATSHSTWFGPRGFERSVTGGQTTDRHELGPVTVERKNGVDIVHANLRDRLGSTVALTNGGATLAATRSYDPFGRARHGDMADRPNGILNLQSATLRGFTGHEHVDDVRLIHMNGRMYDYQLGRFLTVDPVIQFPSNSQSLNPYSYLQNNPFTGTDPSGFCEAATGTHIKTCADVTANFADGSSRNLGSFNTRSSGDMGKAASIALPGTNGADSMSFKGSTSTPANRQADDIGAGGKTVGGQSGIQRLETVTVEASYWTGLSTVPGDWSTSMNGRIIGAEWAWYNEAYANEIAKRSGYDMIAGFYGFQWQMVLSQFGGDAPVVGLAGAAGAIRAAGGAENAGAAFRGALSDSALVCRGGTCAANRFANGSGVSIDTAGNLNGVSVNSANGVSLRQLTSGIPNGQVGVTTVGEIRRTGGSVKPSPTANNPYHCIMCGITPNKAESLFTPTIKNPNGG